MLKSMRNRDVFLKDGELVFVEDISEQMASIISSNSDRVLVPSSLLITFEDYNNILEKKEIDIMNSINENKSKIICQHLKKYNILYIFFTKLKDLSFQILLICKYYNICIQNTL